MVYIGGLITISLIIIGIFKYQRIEERDDHGNYIKLQLMLEDGFRYAFASMGGNIFSFFFMLTSLGKMLEPHHLIFYLFIDFEGHGPSEKHFDKTSISSISVTRTQTFKQKNSRNTIYLFVFTHSVIKRFQKVSSF